jgi:hypothetical protein
MGNDSGKGNEEQRDDLTRIRGIGPVKQQWLRTSLNVCTFRDLASLSIEEIESRLRADGQTTSRNAIANWIDRARELAGDFPEEESKAVRPPEESQWQSFGTFQIEFQSRQIPGKPEESRTVVRHLDTEQSRILHGIETEQLQSWMLEQMSARTPEGEGAAVVPVVVETEQLRVLQPPQTGIPTIVESSEQPLSGFLRANEPFSLDIAFRVAGLTGTTIAKQPITYRAQFYARNRATSEVIHLGDTVPKLLSSGQAYYTTTLADATLSPGLYRLQVLVKLQGAPAIAPGLFEVPLLQVI